MIMRLQSGPILQFRNGQGEDDYREVRGGGKGEQWVTGEEEEEGGLKDYSEEMNLRRLEGRVCILFSLPLTLFLF